VSEPAQALYADANYEYPVRKGVALDPIIGQTIGVLKVDPILDQVAAISCGVFADTPVLDLDYEEDSQAEADGNFVLTGAGTIVEIQATGEKRGFTRAEFDRLFALADGGCRDLFAMQKAAVDAALAKG